MHCANTKCSHDDGVRTRVIVVDPASHTPIQLNLCAECSMKLCSTSKVTVKIGDLR